MYFYRIFCDESFDAVVPLYKYSNVFNAALGMDLTRPSSTPVYADFPKSTIGLTSNPTLTQPFYGQGKTECVSTLPLLI